MVSYIILREGKELEEDFHGLLHTIVQYVFCRIGS